MSHGRPSGAYPLLSLAEARRRLAGLSLPSLRAVLVPIDDALGGWPAGVIRAPRPVPLAPTSAMDGYALARPLDGSATDFRLVRRVRGRMRWGQAVPIATGAVLPAGAVSVARLEATRLEGPRLRLAVPVAPGRDVHGAGSAIAPGTSLAEPSRPIDAYAEAALRAAGIREVRVRPLRVSVFATGTELARPVRGARSTIDSIGPWIAATARRWATVRRERPLPDELDVIERALVRASRTSDLIVTVGGSSVGPRDLTKRAVEAAGEIAIGGTRVNVLKRAGVGRVRGRPVLILPGQIESAVVAFHEYGVPILERWRGTRIRSWAELPLARPFSVDHRMDSTILFAVRHGRAFPLGWGVTRFAALRHADAFGFFRRGRTYPIGARVRVQRLIR